MFLTNTVNFGIGTTFSKGPLFLRIRFIKYIIWWLILEAYLELSQTSTVEINFSYQYLPVTNTWQAKAYLEPSQSSTIELFRENFVLQSSQVSIQRSLFSEVVARSCSVKKVFWKHAVNLMENTHAEMRFHTLTLVFSCKFAAYLQNTFSQEHFWRAASISCNFTERKDSNTAVFQWILRGTYDTFFQNTYRQLLLFYGKLFYQENSKEPSEKRKKWKQLISKTATHAIAIYMKSLYPFTIQKVLYLSFPSFAWYIENTRF